MSHAALVDKRMYLIFIDFFRTFHFTTVPYGRGIALGSREWITYEPFARSRPISRAVTLRNLKG